MKVSEKCPPETRELRRISGMGFERAELYLEKRHLDSFDETLDSCRDAEVDVTSVHTPHVTLEELQYFKKSSRLAEELDAKLVVHSKHINHVDVPKIQRLELSVEHGYENNPGVSVYALENLILGRGEKLVLDTAHLYMAEEEFQDALQKVLERHAEEILVVHLCDSTKMKDGLPLGDGDLDMRETVCKLKDSGFEGETVLEVMPEHQEKVLEFWNSV